MSAHIKWQRSKTIALLWAGQIGGSISWPASFFSVFTAGSGTASRTGVGVKPIPANSSIKLTMAAAFSNGWVNLKGMERHEGLIFTTSTGKPVSPRNILRHFQLALERLGLPKVTFHSLRHLHASYLLRQNVHPKIVQERLGHSSIALTLDVYSHIIPTLQKEAAEKINDIF